MKFITKEGTVIVSTDRFHKHCQVSEELLNEAIIGLSELIDKAFKNGKKDSFTYNFNKLIGVSHCVPCPPHSDGVYFKQRGNRPYLSRMVKGVPIPTSKLTFVLYPQSDKMILITAWIGDKSYPEVGNINRFEEEENPIERMKESVDFWMNHALIEE